MMTYEKFKELQHVIGQPNLRLADVLRWMPDAESKPIHRVNDIALIALLVFAFDAFCSGYVGVTPKPKQPGLRSNLLRKLERKAKHQGMLPDPQIQADLERVDTVFMIRHLWVHGVGRRSGLFCPDDLLPEELKSCCFKPEGDEDDPNAQWWPTRDDSFSECVTPLNALAEHIRDHLTP